MLYLVHTLGKPHPDMLRSRVKSCICVALHSQAYEPKSSILGIDRELPRESVGPDAQSPRS